MQNLDFCFELIFLLCTELTSQRSQIGENKKNWAILTFMISLLLFYF